MPPTSSVALLALGIALSGCATGEFGAGMPGTPLYKAVNEGDEPAVSALLDKGISADEAYFGMPPLVTAVNKDNVGMAKLLLARGATVDAGSGWLMGGRGPTALSIAAMRGRTDIAELLIAKGATIEKALEGLEHQAKVSAPYAASGEPAHTKSLADCRAGKAFLEELRRASPAAAAPAEAHAAGASRPVIAPKFSNAAALDDYAVIVGVETYADLPAASYAERDAAAVRTFIHALGVPDANIVSLVGSGATRASIEKAIEAWLPDKVSERSRVYFFYSGHGAPDPRTGGAFLLPSDGDPRYLERSAYPLKQLYFQLEQLKAKSVLVAIDSCFSGAGGRSVLAKGIRPLVGKVDIAAQAGGKVSVLSASAGDEISGANEEAGYGLFTYNFLQGLNGPARDARGQVTLQSLHAYVTPRVQDDARRVNRAQTPQLQAGGGEDMVLRAASR